MRPVAVAAVGAVTGLGVGWDALDAGLRGGRTAAVPIPGLPAGGLEVAHAAAVSGDVPPLDGFPDDRKVWLLAAAAREAFAGMPAVPAERRGVFLGTGLSSVTPREIDEDVAPFVRDGRVDREAALARVGASGVSPGRHLPERATAWLAAEVGAKGPVGTTFSACAAGAEAIVAGARAIARGEADVALVGGHDAMIHPLGLASFDVLGVLTHTTCRPFDLRRDGFLLGEGAAVLRLEAAELCARPLAWILGAGTSLDAWGITAPHPQGHGAEAAMRRALRDAGLDPSAVGWVHAHGTGTTVGDAVEAGAVARVFGPGTPTSSLKGALGHTLAAAGAVEAAATVVALVGDYVPGTVGCDQPDDFDIDVVQALRGGAPDVVLSNSFGFGGQNCSIVFRRP